MPGRKFLATSIELNICLHSKTNIVQNKLFFVQTVVLHGMCYTYENLSFHVFDTMKHLPFEMGNFINTLR